MATAPADHNLPGSHLHSGSLPLIDIRLLSQSDLLSLSFCSPASSSALRPLQTDPDLATPKIDRSVFNESAGSRKQTFSRLRLAPPRKNNDDSQFSSSSLPFKSPFLRQSADQTLDEENSQIVSLLKSLFGADISSPSNANQIDNDNDENLVSVPVQYQEHLCLPYTTKSAQLQNFPFKISDSGGQFESKQGTSTAIVDSGTAKRKRGRPRKNENNSFDNVNGFYNNQSAVESENKEKAIVVCENVETEREVMVIVNEGGVPINLLALGRLEDPYGDEFRRRTEGMRTAEELLRFLEGLDGQWRSSSRKKKIVEASLFGDVLPRGWKLMLCVRKRAGHVWLACRRYIRFLTIASC